MMDKDLVAKIEKYIQDGTKQITYGNSKTGFSVIVNEDIDFNEVHSAIDTIVENVIAQEQAFEIIDLLTGYYVIKLFTNIPVPLIEDAEAEDGHRPDYSKCNEIVAKLDLINKLASTSSIVAFYLDMLLKNVWRKLDYNKAMLSVMPYNDLLDAIAEFYAILDEFAEVSNNNDLDLDKFKSTIDDFANKLSELQPEMDRAKLKLVEDNKE